MLRDCVAQVARLHGYCGPADGGFVQKVGVSSVYRPRYQRSPVLATEEGKEVVEVFSSFQPEYAAYFTVQRREQVVIGSDSDDEPKIAGETDEVVEEGAILISSDSSDSSDSSGSSGSSDSSDSSEEEDGEGTVKERVDSSTHSYLPSRNMMVTPPETLVSCETRTQNLQQKYDDLEDSISIRFVPVGNLSQ